MNLVGLDWDCSDDEILEVALSVGLPVVYVPLMTINPLLPDRAKVTFNGPYPLNATIERYRSVTK